MATPSSSATSPSPTLAFSPPLHTPAPDPDLPEQDHRKRAVEKFKARAEISNVTRSLRARLSYASYKAAHNVAHVPLRELEAQTQAQVQIFSRTMAAKRKASAVATTYANSIGNNNYYNNPATQGGASNSPGASGLRRPGHGAMAPPLGVGGPRTYYPAAVNAAAGGSGVDAATPRVMPAQSLFTSILAPPPTQQARTILNVADPPVPPPSRPPASPRPRTSKPSARSIAEGTRAMQKASSRRDDKPDSKRKAKRPLDKGKQKQRRHDSDVDADGDVDMKAAATLTSLLLNHRPSIGSASSPRSSLDDDESGSTQSYSHFAQSSARHGGTLVPPPQSAPPAGTGASSSSAGPLPEFRRASATPPPTQPSSQTQGQTQTTPRPAPTDNEAADLMLFLATSPSPVRKDARDLAAYRALNGGVRPKGRVLFPTAGQLAGGDADAPSRTGSALARGGDSFTSSVSSIGGEMRAGSRTPTPANASPAPSQGGSSAQLLPPPPLPAGTLSTAPPARTATASPSGAKPVYGQVVPPPPSQQQQQQPGQENFNFGEFLHASPRGAPSPAPTAPAPAPGQMQVQQPGQMQVQQPQGKSGLGLRADVGRKLFEEEQMRHHLQVAASHGHGQHEGKGAGRAELGAGIDLVQQS
ncbi:hypothetical protein B0H19DRAFT_1223339 [Mycena capillaripes]|nr:hypothetical protein B0H19DRAFT_1223339 [Mycena capillaripes]